MTMKTYLIALSVVLSAMLPLTAAAQDGEQPVLQEGRPVLHQNSDGDPSTYMPNRRALVGRGCNVNKLVNTVGVGSWVENLEALTDEDLGNYTTIPKIVSVGVTVDPSVSVRDMNHYYAGGTQAGFCLVASSGSSVLSLDVIEAMSIMFLRDGNEVGTVSVEEGQSAGGVGLSLISVPGSEDANIYLTATAPEVFDEVALVDAGGVNLAVGNTLLVKYAFVGKPKETLLTIDGVPASLGDDYELSDWVGYNPVLLGLPLPMLDDEIYKVVDPDLDNTAVSTPIIAVGYQGGVKLTAAKKGSNEEVFKAGTEVGFVWEGGQALALTVGSWVDIVLFAHNPDKEGEYVEVQRTTLEGNVLGLNVAGGNRSTSSIIANVDYSAAEIRLHTVLAVNLGAFGFAYGFVREGADVEHHCDINPTYDTNLCEAQTSIQLEANPQLSVTWSLESAPDGSAVVVNEGGKVTNMDVNGDYVFRATSACGYGCSELVVINKGETIGSQAGNICGEPLVNRPGLDGAISNDYALTDDLHGSSGSLLSLTDMKDVDHILDTDYDNCATYISGLSVANNLMIIGVKTTDGSNIYDGSVDKYPAKLGFMVEMESEGLDVSALQFFLIRGYKDGNQVFEKVITETDVVSVGLAGSNRQQKMRFCVEVGPTNDEGGNLEVDEIMLWKAGVLNLTVSTLNIYYPFKEVLDPEVGDCGDPFGCDYEIISAAEGGTGAKITIKEQGGAVNVLSVSNNYSYFIDGDLETPMTLTNTVTVGGGTVFSVKPGRTLDFHHQLCIVVDNNTYLAGVKAGSWLTVRTYYQGTPTGDEFSNWNVLGVNAIGYGDKSILLLQPKARYDEVEIEVASIASLLDFEQNFYGMFLRGDVDGDGTPDCQDPSSCFTEIEDLELNQICQGDEMTISGTVLKGVDYYISMPEQGIFEQLPVTDEGDKATFNVSYTLNVTGRYTMIFYDGSMNIVDTHTYTVHPTYTEWKTNPVNTDWNEWTNWTAGSPYCCTDVVINGGAAVYPQLPGDVAAADDYCCNLIHFKSQAAVDRPTSLNYNKAWVDIELAPNQYHLLSAPLKSMYTGDMFVPAGDAAVGNFDELNETNTPQNRFNPRVYQRLWASTAQGRLYDGTTTTLGTETIQETEWSRHFNALNYLYPLGEGFSMWVDNEDLPATQRFVFRFPKAHTSYNYYSDYDGSMLDVKEEGLDRTDGGRFIYESGSEDSQPLQFDYKGEQRNVYTNVLPLTVTLQAEEGGETSNFLVGNPFMGRIDIASFIAGNEGVTAVKLYDGSNVVSVNADLQSNGADVTKIEPMQSFFIELDAPASSRDVVFTAEMLDGAAVAAQASAPALRVIAETGGEEAAVLLLGDADGVAVHSLVDGEVRPSLAVYSLCDGEAFDIMPLASAVTPLAITAAESDTLTLRFAAEGGFDTYGYELRDNLTGISYPLDGSVTIEGGASSVGRYALVNTSLMDEGMEQTDVFVTLDGRRATVSSTGEPITGIVVCGLDGRVETAARMQGVQQTDVVLYSDIQVIKVSLADGTSRSLKVLAR